MYTYVGTRSAIPDLDIYDIEGKEIVILLFPFPRYHAYVRREWVDIPNMVVHDVGRKEIIKY